MDELSLEERQARTVGDVKSFEGEPFEGLGSIWEGLYPLFLTELPTIINNGSIDEQSVIKNAQQEFAVGLLQYPALVGLRVGCLLEHNKEENHIAFISGFPLLDGYMNTLTILARYTWENGLEGEVAAEMSGTNHTISFFAPYYFRDAEKFSPDTNAEVALSAIAFSLKKSTMLEFNIDKGPLYEMSLDRYLQEQPEKKQEDFPHVKVSCRGMVACMATETTCTFQYRSPILDARPCLFLGIPCWCLLITLARNEEEGEDMRAYIYVSEEKLAGYTPQVGDDVEGVCWLMGNLVSKYTDEANK